MSAEDDLAPENDRRVEIRCANGHEQVLALPCHSLLQAWQLAADLDGTSAAYRPGETLVVGGCRQCGAAFKATVKGYAT